MKTECAIIARGKAIKKLYCRVHRQHLMYVYLYPDGSIGYRCQVGEDLHSHPKKTYKEQESG